MRNIEKLRNYFLGKDPQLKETMADNSLRLIGIEGKHFVLRTELLKRLVELRHQMEDADEALQKNIDDVVEDLATEATTREGRDTELAGEIAREKLARVAADNTLDGRFNNYYTKGQIDSKVGVTTLPADIVLDSLHPSPLQLKSGVYYTGDYKITTDLVSDHIMTTIVPTKTLFFYDESYRSFDIISHQLESIYPYNIRRIVKPDDDNNVWETTDYDILDAIEPYQDVTGKAASTKAVYDYVGEKVKHNYSATEQAVGSWISPGNTLYEQVIFGNFPQSIVDGVESVSTYSLPDNCFACMVKNAWVYIFEEGVGIDNNVYCLPYTDLSSSRGALLRVVNKSSGWVLEAVANSSKLNGCSFTAVIDYTKT